MTGAAAALAVFLAAPVGAAPRLWESFLNDKPAGKALRCGAFPKLVLNHTVSMCGSGSKGVHAFYQHVCRQRVVSDKVATHTYYSLYGVHLMPLIAAPHPIKMLEIGLGCDMYEVGASATIWRSLLPTAEIWLAEYDAACATAMQAKGKLDGLNVLTGDQGDPATLARWIAESKATAAGRLFDVIIDDGGHANSQILTTFDKLWPALRPGGYYFMEDLQAGRATSWPQTRPQDRQQVVSDVIQGWIEELLLGRQAVRRHFYSRRAMPRDVEFISCQREMCLLAKTARETPAPLAPLR